MWLWVYLFIIMYHISRMHQMVSYNSRKLHRLSKVGIWIFTPFISTDQCFVSHYAKPAVLRWPMDWQKDHFLCLCIMGKWWSSGSRSRCVSPAQTHSYAQNTFESSGVHWHKMTFRNDVMKRVFCGICGACQCSNIQTFFNCYEEKKEWWWYVKSFVFTYST